MRGKKLACDKSEYENQAGKEFLAGKEPTTRFLVLGTGTSS